MVKTTANREIGKFIVCSRAVTWWDEVKEAITYE